MSYTKSYTKSYTQAADQSYRGERGRGGEERGLIYCYSVDRIRCHSGAVWCCVVHSTLTRTLTFTLTPMMQHTGCFSIMDNVSNIGYMYPSSFFLSTRRCFSIMDDDGTGESYTKSYTKSYTIYVRMILRQIMYTESHIIKVGESDTSCSY